MKTLSVAIPAYNEEKSLASLLDQILAVDLTDVGFQKELIVINDGSADRTSEIARAYTDAGVRCIDQIPNQGKGRAVQAGIAASSGDYILVQDADLEYDPRDYVVILRGLKTGADCVYGSRTLGQIRRNGWTLFPGRHPNQAFGPWLAGVLLSACTFVLYGRWISDTLTAYKLYPRSAIQPMRIETCGFETDHEITAKLIRGGYRITEVPVAYHPRTSAEGKKIRARDGFIAIWTLLKYRFFSSPRRRALTARTTR